ncbi:hypothetical protein [Rhodopseudomonas sp. RCAM05734]
MTRTLRTFALFAVLALATPAVAHDGQVAAIRATQAAAALQTYNDNLRDAGRRPDYTSVPAADLLRAVFDTDRLAALPEPTAKDIGWLMDWGNAASRGYKQILLFGLPPGQKPDEATMTRNLEAYEGEVATAMNFMVRVLARQMDAAALFISELPKTELTPARIEGFRMVRSGSGEVLEGALLTVAQGMKPRNAQLVMAAAGDTRSTWIHGLYPEDRTKVMRLLKEIVKRVGDKEVTDSAAVLLTAFATEK